MAALQKYDLNLGMSPLLLKTFFAGASTSVSADSCVLDRIEMIWRDNAEPEIVTTPVLVFPYYAFAKADMMNEMAFAIECDVERLNLSYDIEDEILANPSNDHLSCSQLNITNPHLREDVSSVDTLYRLKTHDKKTYDLFIMREVLLQQVSEQIEIGVRKAMADADKNQQKTAVLFQPKSRNYL